MRDDPRTPFDPRVLPLRPRRRVRGCIGPPEAETPPTDGEIRAALLRAYRGLAPRAPAVTLVVAHVRLLPPRPGRPGRDLPAGRAGTRVYPARVRYEVGRGGPDTRPDARSRAHSAPSAPTVVVDATYRFWRDGGAWAFTGPLAATVVGGGLHGVGAGPTAPA